MIEVKEDIGCVRLLNPRLAWTRDIFFPSSKTAGIRLKVMVAANRADSGKNVKARIIARGEVVVVTYKTSNESEMILTDALIPACQRSDKGTDRLKTKWNTAIKKAIVISGFNLPISFENGTAVKEKNKTVRKKR